MNDAQRALMQMIAGGPTGPAVQASTKKPKQGGKVGKSGKKQTSKDQKGSTGSPKISRAFMPTSVIRKGAKKGSVQLKQKQQRQPQHPPQQQQQQQQPQRQQRQTPSMPMTMPPVQMGMPGTYKSVFRKETLKGLYWGLLNLFGCCQML